MYKCIAFDMDGTLLNSEKVIFITLKKTVEKFLHKSMSDEDLKFALGIPGDETIVRLGIKNVFEALEYWDMLYYEMRDHIQPYHGVQNTLSILKDKRYKVALVTSGYRKEVEDHMVRLNMMDCFDIMICADDTTLHKPNADPLIRLMQDMKIEKQDLLYIGDSIYDSECAQNAGVDFALALWGANNTDIFGKYRLRNIEEVIKVVK